MNSKLTLPLVPHFTRIQIRHCCLLIVLAFCTLMIIPSANAALTCAARSYSKPDLSAFRQSVMLTIPGTPLLDHSQQLTYKLDRPMFPGTRLLNQSQQLRKYRNETAFNAATALFLSNHFSPKDIVCIADSDETETALKQSRIWDTYGGNTVLLSPFHAVPAETRHGPRESNVFSLLAEITAEARFPVPSGCHAFMSRDSEAYQLCISKVYNSRVDYRDELISTLPQAVLGAPSLAILETYDPKKPNKESNAVAFTAFIGAVKTLEALGAPFYALPAPTDGMPEPQFRVFDPVSGERLPVTSLLRFVGNELVDIGTSLLVREHSDMINEFNSEDVAEIDILPHSQFVAAQYSTFHYKDPLEQMLRVFVCRDGGSSGVRIFDIDANAVLSAFKRIGCPSFSLHGKEVVNFGDSLLEQEKLSSKLQLVSDTETQTIIRQKLTELAQLGVGQSKTLNEVHKYVGEGELLNRVRQLNEDLHALEQARDGNILSQLAGIAGAVGSIYTGYAGVGALLGGITEIGALYSGMPSADFEGAMDYYHKNRLEFSEAANIAGNGVKKIVKAVGDFHGAVDSVSNEILDNPDALDEIAKVKIQIRELEEERESMVREIAERADELEKEWVRVAEDLFEARQAARSWRRNLAIISEDVIAHKFLHSVQTGDLYGDWGRCIAALKRASDSSTGSNPVPILESCGGIDEALSEVRECLRRDVDASTSGNLVIEGKNKVFWIGKGGARARDCYRNSLWQEQDERRGGARPVLYH